MCPALLSTNVVSPPRSCTVRYVPRHGVRWSLIAPATKAGTVMLARSIGLPRQVIPPGVTRGLRSKMSRNCPCSAPGTFVPSAFHDRMSNSGGSRPIR